MKFKLFFWNEFAGTFLIVFWGTGSVLAHQLAPNLIPSWTIALSFGLAVFSAIMLFGGDFNPAVSWVPGIRKENGIQNSVFKTISQLAGAITAALVLFGFDHGLTDYGLTQYHGTWMQAFAWEAGMSFILFAGVRLSLHFQTKTVILAWVAGSIVALEAYIGGPITGASMNPARSIGPAIVQLHWKQWDVYLIAPIVGMYLCDRCYSALFMRK